MTVCFDFINEKNFANGAQQDWRLAELRSLRLLSKGPNESSAGKLSAALKNMTVVQSNKTSKSGVVFVLKFEWVQMPNSTFRMWHDLILLLDGNGYHARLEHLPEKQVMGSGKERHDGRFFPIFVRNARVNTALLTNKTVCRNINDVPLIAGAATQGMSKAEIDRENYYLAKEDSLVIRPQDPNYHLTGAEPAYELR